MILATVYERLIVALFGRRLCDACPALSGIADIAASDISHFASQDFRQRLSLCFQDRQTKMQRGTIISYSEDQGRPQAEIALHNGDRVQLALNRNGLSIKRLAGPGRPAEILFQANQNQVSRICAGLFRLDTTPKPTPLCILVAAVVQLGSAEQVRNVFREAAAQL